MEKLQAAIDKARKKRTQGEDKEIIANLPVPDESDRLWAGFKTSVLEPRTISKNRIIALESGKDSSPIDMLRTRVLQQARQNDWTRIAIVSPTAGCGKSTMTANLACSLSKQRELRTVALDLDMRRCGLGKVLNTTVERTMGDVLLGNIDFADHGVALFPNVAFGLNKTTVSNSSEILQSEMATKVLNDIQARFRPNIMLFDMPPLLSSDDNVGFLKNVDCAVLIAEADKSTIHQVDIAEQQLAELTNVMGTVLNKSKFASNAYGVDYD